MSCLFPLLSSDLLLWVAWRLIKKEVWSDPRPISLHVSTCSLPPPPASLFLSVPSDIKCCVSVFEQSQNRADRPHNVSGVWVMGCTHTHAHTSFIPSFSLSRLIHTLLWPWNGCILYPLCPLKHLIFTVCVCRCTSECIYTNKNLIDHYSPTPTWVTIIVCVLIQAPALVLVDWFLFPCVFCTCAAGAEWKEYVMVIFVLLTSQFIRWLLGPWGTRGFSLSSLFSFSYLSSNSKKTFNRN